MQVMFEDAALAWTRGDTQEALTLWSIASKREPDRPDLKELMTFGFRVLADEEAAMRGNSASPALDGLILESAYAHLRAVGPGAKYAPPKASLNADERRAMRLARTAALARRQRLARMCVAIIAMVSAGLAWGYRFQEAERMGEVKRTQVELDHALTLGQHNVAKTLTASLFDGLDDRAESDAARNYYTGQLALLEGDTAKTLMYGKMAARFEDEHPNVYSWGYARALARAGRGAEALQVYAQVFTDWADPAMWMDYADALLDSGRLEHAESMLALVVTNKRPEATEALARLSYIATVRGDKAAATQLRGRAERDPKLSIRARAFMDSVPPAGTRLTPAAKAQRPTAPTSASPTTPPATPPDVN